MKKSSILLLFFTSMIGYNNTIFAQTTVPSAATKSANPKAKSASDQVFKYKKEFTYYAKISSINKSAVPACKNLFNKTCGTEDYPSLHKFGVCLHNNFEKLKSVPECDKVAKAIIYANLLGTFVSTVPICRPYVAKCSKERAKGKSGNQCMLQEAELPPVCRKLTEDSYLYRKSLAELYDPRVTNMKSK